MTKRPQHAVPAHLLGREGPTPAKALSKGMKQKRKERVAQWAASICAQGDTEVLNVIQTGKRKKKVSKRLVTKVCFVGGGFTLKPRNMND